MVDEPADSIDWANVNLPMAERILTQGELFMSAQLQAALAADSRATTMAGMFITLALAVIAGGVAWGNSRAGLPYLLGGFANCIRHTHPGLASLEQPQFPDFGHSQGDKVRDVARWLDGELANQPYVAGARFTIADITTFIALEFARGLMKFSPGEEGMLHLQAYRDRWMDRPSAKVQ